MRTPGLLASTLALAMATAGIDATAFAAPATKPATASKPAPAPKEVPAKAATMWGDIDAKLAGTWAATKVMAKGYLASLQKKAAAKHPNFAKLALASLATLNKGFETVGACWANLRIAFANVLGGAAKGAGQPLAGPMKPVLAAFDKASGTKGAALDKALGPVDGALHVAIKAFKNGAPYRKAIFGAGIWLRKPCNLNKLTGGADPKELKDFAKDHFAEFQKLLPPQSIAPIKEYFESLKGPAQQAFDVLARGILRVASRISEVLTKAGKSGLGIEDLFNRSAQNVVTALALRRYKSGDGATRWTFARLRNLTERMHAVLNESGAGGTGFMKLIEGAILKLKARVRDLSGGKKKFVKGRASAAMKGFRAALTAAWKKVVAKLKPNLKVAKESFALHLEGFIDIIGKPRTVLFGRYAPDFSGHDKGLKAWFEKLQKNQRSGHRVLVKGFGSLLADGRVAVAQVATKGAVAAYNSVAGVLVEILAAGAKKNLILGKGLGKFITDSLAKFPIVYDKAITTLKAGSPAFKAFITGALTTAAKAVITRAKEVLAGKQKAGPGKITFWFKGSIEALGKAFPKKVNDQAFASMLKGKPPKDLVDFLAALAK